jgi:hypothetical protein
MMKLLILCIGLVTFLPSASAQNLDSQNKAAISVTVPQFQRLVWIWLENTPYTEMQYQRFIQYLWFQVGAARFTKIKPISKVTQANAIAMIMGNDYGVADNDLTRLFAPSLVDLLEVKKVSWKVYADEYPESCYLNAGYGNYRRYRVPFLSLNSIQSDRYLCAKVAGNTSFAYDVKNGLVPRLAVLIPNLHNSGAVTTTSTADQTLSNLLQPFLAAPEFYKDTTYLISTVNSVNSSGQTVEGFHMIFGKHVNINGTTSAKEYTPYSILRTIELGLGLDHLNQNDALAEPILEGWSDR